MDLINFFDSIIYSFKQPYSKTWNILQELRKVFGAYTIDPDREKSGKAPNSCKSGNRKAIIIIQKSSRRAGWWRGISSTRLPVREMKLQIVLMYSLAWLIVSFHCGSFAFCGSRLLSTDLSFDCAFLLAHFRFYHPIFSFKHSFVTPQYHEKRRTKFVC